MAERALSFEDVDILFEPNFLTALVKDQEAKHAGTRPTRGHSNDVDSESIAKILNKKTPENKMAQKWLDVALGQDRPALDEEQARVAFRFSKIRHGQEQYQGATEALSYINKVRKDKQYDTRLQVDIRAYLRTKRLEAKEERMTPELPSPRTNKKKRRLSNSSAGPSVRTRSRTRDTDHSTSPVARRSSRQRSDVETPRVKAEDLTPADALSPKRRSKKQKTKKEVDTPTRVARSASVAGSSKRKRDDEGDEPSRKRTKSEDASPAFSASSPGPSSSKRKSKRQKFGTKDGADATSSLFVSTQRRSERVAVKASKLVKEEDDTAAAQTSLASASISSKHRKRHADPKPAALLQPSIPSGSQEIAPHLTADGPSSSAKKHDKRQAKKRDSEKGNKTHPDPSSTPPRKGPGGTAAPTVPPSLDPSQSNASKDAVSVTEIPALHATGALPPSTPPKRQYKKRREKAASAPLPSPQIRIAEHATSASAPPPSFKPIAPENELPASKQESELDGLLVLAEPKVEVEELPEQSRVLMGLGLGAECDPPINRPAYPFRPPVWAQSRQEVCESFPWFRSYQGGVYFSQGHAKGYLLSKFASLRDGWFHKGKLIISHGGGKAESVSFAKGKTEKRSASDQKEHDKSVTALLNNYRRRVPLVLLIDDHYVHFPFDLKASNYAYVALGFYFISDVWMEYQPATNDLGRVVRYKFAFQWCGNQGEPWWCNEPSNIPAGPNIDQPKGSSKRRVIVKKSHESEIIQSTNEIVFPRGNVGQTCQECKKQSPQVYSSGWMCLHSGCSKFWRCGVDGPMPQTLVFNLEFLQLLDEPVQRAKHEHLKPGLPVKPDDEASKLGTGIDFTRGWHCSNCGRLSCRYRWKCWECPCCRNTFGVSITIQRPIDLTKTLQIHAPGKTYHAEQGIEVQPHKLSSPVGNGHGLLACDTFILPDNAGSIHRISVASKSLNKRADKIFDRYQTQASDGTLEFRRWPMRAHKCRGALLTNYFSHNCGEPYHYVGGADNTVPWEGAPSAVVEARALIQAHLKQALNIDYEFNEVLSAAYMEDQSMAFHSDSEKGLDSIVAGLSLGSPAKMIFRLHAKFLGAVSEGSGPQPTGKLRPNALTIILQHGDVLVMEGAGIQERYEHTVIPGGFRIAATARKIGGQ